MRTVASHLAAAPGIHAARLPRSLKLALVALALYVAWSYLSITWANSPGDALTGSNRALLYLLVVAAFALTPWTAARARGVLLVYVIGVGVIGALTLITMARGHHSASLFVDGRLSSPIGYINANAALCTTAAFVAIALAVDKTLAPPVRGVLAAIACGGIELALLAESRGWLFLLPLMLAAAVAVAPPRLRIATAAVLPALGALAILPTLLDVFKTTEGGHPAEHALKAAAEHAGRAALFTCGIAFGTATLLAILETHIAFPAPSVRLRRAIGGLAATAAIAACVSGGLIATHGHPISFIDRQLGGSVSQLDTFRASHFELSGTGRFDIWRVSLDAAMSHPIGGLGQDNFSNYYYLHRHSSEEARWTHSLELRLLVHTGVVGFALFAAFLACALTAALHSRRHAGPEAGQLAGVALLPVVVWLIHGSIDWFWEIPALTGPALGFLAMAGGLGAAPEQPRSGTSGALPRTRLPASRMTTATSLDPQFLEGFHNLCCLGLLWFETQRVGSSGGRVDAAACAHKGCVCACVGQLGPRIAARREAMVWNAGSAKAPRASRVGSQRRLCGRGATPSDRAASTLGTGMKRVLDVLIALTLLAVSLPVLLIIALAIKLDSPGPVFYRVLRIGFRGRPFMMLKFRKMHHNATGLPLTADADDRLTRIGRLLVRTRLDEVPQLWDVLRGRMSIVGPRPEDPVFVRLHDEAYDRILSVRPGLTGVSQLAFAEERRILDASNPVGDYVDRILPQKVGLDTMYAESYRLRMDLAVIRWTVVAILLRRPVAVHRSTGRMTVRKRPPLVERADGRPEAEAARRR